jgi:hypothetical protein
MVVYGAYHCAGQLGETGPPRPLCYAVQSELVPALTASRVKTIHCAREGDPRGWSMVLVTALGSWGKPVSRRRVSWRGYQVRKHLGIGFGNARVSGSEGWGYGVRKCRGIGFRSAGVLGVPAETSTVLTYPAIALLHHWPHTLGLCIVSDVVRERGFL